MTQSACSLVLQAFSRVPAVPHTQFTSRYEQTWSFLAGQKMETQPDLPQWKFLWLFAVFKQISKSQSAVFSLPFHYVIHITIEGKCWFSLENPAEVVDYQKLLWWPIKIFFRLLLFQQSCRWTWLTIAKHSDISAVMDVVFPLLGATAASATKDSNCMAERNALVCGFLL